MEDAELSSDVRRREPTSDAPLEHPPPERDLAGALHEVSNSLTVVLGWIEQARIEGGPEVADALDIAAFRARQARHIVRRAIGADVPVDPPCSVAELVRDAVKGLEPEAWRLKVQLHAAVEPAISSAMIDQPSRALQILTNLLLNAFAVSPAGAHVQIDAREDGAGVVLLSVADEGPGISLQRRATLFDAGVSTTAGGAGIGLRHASALARTAGGDLSLAESVIGARFELRWPCSLPNVTRRRSSMPVPGGILAGVRVLIVEDDDAVIDLLDTALTARGATVVSAKSPIALQEALSSGHFDAALLDISPIQDDFAGAFDAVRSSSPSAKLIVISGSAGNAPSFPEDIEATWVRKPFEIREIVEALAR